MGKTFGEIKQKYSDHRSKASHQKPVRNYVKSFLNHNKYNEEIIEEFIFPLKSSNTYTWWDVKPYKPKVF
jgi:hypothetical protein